jgi:hypothetical protein
VASTIRQSYGIQTSALSIHHDKLAAVLAFNLYCGSAQCEKPGQFIKEAAANYSFAEYTTQFNGRTPTTV